VQKVVAEATAARKSGATRFCMGAAWKNPSEKDFPQVLEMVRQVRDLGMETCMTLGALSQSQTDALAAAGLDYYNHNLDTSPEFYGQIISTHTFQDRLDTLVKVRASGMKVCCGGIVGMGEGNNDRAGLLQQLANMPEHPESVPINMLVKVKGTPLEHAEDTDPFDFVRTIAIARLLMPRSYVRLSAGRNQMSEQMQTLCFMAGANSIFYGEKLLTTPLPEESSDLALLSRLGLKPEHIC
jgi:biotin synthase